MIYESVQPSSNLEFLISSIFLSCSQIATSSHQRSCFRYSRLIQDSYKCIVYLYGFIRWIFARLEMSERCSLETMCRFLYNGPVKVQILLEPKNF